MSLPIARRLMSSGARTDAADTVSLSYDARFLRRRRLVAEGGLAFLVDLPRATSAAAGEAFALDDGRVVAVVAAVEPLYAVTGTGLLRFAWHIGNRHAPCEIGANRLLIARDPVLRDMLDRLGADVREVEHPFTPEGGAYGQGRTHGHDASHVHGPDGAGDHGHDHHHGHHDGHGQDHDPAH